MGNITKENMQQFWSWQINFQPYYREEMNEETLKNFISNCFDSYEKCGFADVFTSPFDLCEVQRKYLSKPFKVIGRCEKDSTHDYDSLPMWKIQFDDGYVMEAYPEEICLWELEN